MTGLDLAIMWESRLGFSFHLKNELNVPTCCVTVGANDLMGFVSQRLGLFCGKRGSFNMHFHGNSISAAFTRTNRRATCNNSSLHVDLLLTGLEFESSSKACRISRSKHMHWHRSTRQFWPTHSLAHRT